jgi:hypothetical protein
MTFVLGLSSCKAVKASHPPRHLSHKSTTANRTTRSKPFFFEKDHTTSPPKPLEDLSFIRDPRPFLYPA